MNLLNIARGKAWDVCVVLLLDVSNLLAGVEPQEVALAPILLHSYLYPIAISKIRRALEERKHWERSTIKAYSVHFISGTVKRIGSLLSKLDYVYLQASAVHDPLDRGLQSLSGNNYLRKLQNTASKGERERGKLGVSPKFRPESRPA